MTVLGRSSRTRTKRLKKKMLRQAVSENLRAMDGPAAPPRRRSMAWLPVFGPRRSARKTRELPQSSFHDPKEKATSS